jgi:hypothetical protein
MVGRFWQADALYHAASWVSLQSIDTNRLAFGQELVRSGSPLDD